MEAGSWRSGCESWTSWDAKASWKISKFWRSWKFLEKLEEAGKLEASWKILDAKYMNKYSASWKLDKLELYFIRASWKFKIIKFIFINKFLFLFIFKK